MLVRHGGHSRAAGFTVRNERLAEMTEALTALATQQLGGRDDLRPTLWIDAEVSLDDVTWALHSQLARLEPCGQENSPPLFLSRRCYVRDVRTVGRDSDHLKLVLRAPNYYTFDAIGFGLGNHAAGITAGGYLDLLFQLEVNEWQGRKALQLNVQDVRVAE